MRDKLSPAHLRPSFWSAFFAVALLCGLYAPPSLATAIYLGHVRGDPANPASVAELRITGISGGSAAELIIDGSVCSCAGGDSLFDGNASASHAGAATVRAAGGNPANLAVGDGLDLHAEVSGSASPSGIATSIFDAEAELGLTNNSSSSIFTIMFQLVWSLRVDTSIDDPALEYAFGATGIYAETAGSDPDNPLILLDKGVESDALAGDGLVTDAGTLTFSIDLAPGATDYVFIAMGAFGLAFAESIPEPGVIPLLAVGFAALGFFARRRRR